MTTIVSIAQGGTGANNAAAARNTLGAAANTGGVFTGAINVATANITTIVTGNALTLSTGTASNGNIIFSANGSEDMRITNTGFIGIFTSTPNSNLTVVGNVWATTGINAATLNASTVNVTSTLGGGSTLTIQPNVTISQSLTVTGNLIVSGSSTTLNTEILIVEDADIVLLSNVTGTPVLNSGITVNRGTSTNTFLRWSEDGDRWGWTDDGTTFYSFDNVRNGLVTTNTTFATINTTTATMNTATTNRVLKAGDTMTGNLIVSGATINTATANITTIITGNVLTLGTGSGSNANIIFSANSAEDMRIDAVTGNIAIGVSNTSQRLYVGVSVTDSTNGSSTAANSYPISRFMAHGSGGGIRGLEIGGPAGGINSPVYIKVADTSVRFSILNNTGTEQLTILNGGDVGIGTTSPGVKLDVIGAIRSSTTTSGNTVSATTDFRLNNATFSRVAIGDGGGGWLGGYSITYSSGAVYSDLGFLSGIYYTNGGTIQFYTGPSANAGTAAPERMRITSGGSVGIGTNNPATRLDVRGYVTSDVNSNSVEGGFYLGNSNHGIRRPAAVNDVYVYTSGGSLYLGGGGSSSQNVAITTGGDFLIGTTSSLGKITSTGSGDQSIYFTHSDNSPGRTVTLRLGTNNSTYATYSAYVQAIQGSGIDNYSLAFGTSAAAVAAERMRITNGGNVAIGTTTAGEKLSVNGAIESLVDAGGGANEGGQIVLRAPAGGNTRWNMDNFTNKFRIFREDDSNKANGAAYFHIINGGNVGIGTDNPNIRLHVVSGAGANYSSTVNKSNNMFGISVTSTTNTDTMQGIWFASGTDGAGTHWSGIVGARENNAVHWGTKLVFYTHDQNSSNLDQANERLAITGFGGFHRRYKTEHFILREFAELGSNFDNPTQNIITLPTTGATNSVLMVKVIVRQVAYATSVANEHIGYARAMWNGSSWDLNVSTMSVVGNANLANVGTLSWSTRTLVYTSNRASNYDNYLVSYEVFNPAQVNLTYVF